MPSAFARVHASYSDPPSGDYGSVLPCCLLRTVEFAYMSASNTASTPRMKLSARTLPMNQQCSGRSSAEEFMIVSTCDFRMRHALRSHRETGIRGGIWNVHFYFVFFSGGVGIKLIESATSGCTQR